MSFFECKICGCAIETKDCSGAAECDHCGIKQTVPAVSDDKACEMFVHANSLRMKSEFDMASELYSEITRKFPDEPEGYWGLVLCKAGVQYIIDDETGEYSLISQRKMLSSLSDDEDYNEVLRCAGQDQTALYESEAKKIDSFRADVSCPAGDPENNEADELVRNAYSSLEEGDFDSADYYAGKALALSPCKAEAYLVRLMAELGISRRDSLRDQPHSFENNDNFRAVMKYGDETLKSEMQGYADYITKRNLRAYQSSIYHKAVSVFENPRSTEEEIVEANKMFETISDFRDAKNYLDRYEDRIKEIHYCEAFSLFNMNPPEKEDILRAKEIFESIGDYKDAAGYPEKCDNKIKMLGSSAVYRQAKEKLSMAKQRFDQTHRDERVSEAVDYLMQARLLFQSIEGYKDSRQLIQECNDLRAEYEDAGDVIEAEQAEAQAVFDKKLKIGGIIGISAGVLIAAYVIIFVLIPQARYNNAVYMLEQGKFDEAITAFEDMGDYKDSAQQITMAKYKQADSYLLSGSYEKAAAIFSELGNYEDSAEKKTESEKTPEYLKASEMYSSGKYNEAAALFGELGDYRDSAAMKAEALSAAAFAALSESDKKDILKKQQYISAGYFDTIGLTADAGAIAAGNNESGQCDVKAWKELIGVYAGMYHTAALKSDGTVVAAGNNENGQCNVGGWKNIVSVSAGGNKTVALTADGKLLAAGSNKYGQCDVGSWENIIAVSAGGYHTAALKADGTVEAVGHGMYGQLNVNEWTDITAVSAGDSHTVGLKSDGTVVAAGSNKHGQCNISDWKNVVAVSAGGIHTVGLKADGTVYAAGSNMYGECNVKDWKDIIAVAAGDFYTVGLKSDGTLVTAGSNSDGQLDLSDWKLK